ncbi:MAG: serine/threonine protein kinase [Pyrinomonadaceae bacterium]
MIGQIIGNYKIEEKLGEGGMGAVYKGVDTMLDREVAIKALKPELASQDSIVERFRTEAVTLAKLNHPNIATLYSMFRQGEELYMVLEFVRGETLDSIMKKRGALSAEEAIPVFCQVLDGIDHAHELGIIHRDIKPANMMLTEKGTLKVLDFGIARLLGSARMTRAGNIIGTLEYMAPEQVRGHETDGRSDIYALGMMLYEVLTGQLPFQTENEFELMKSQTEMTPTPPREINPNIPIGVEAAIMKAIQKDPADRFQTGGDFRETLLDAGFAGDGQMHGATGTFRKSSTKASKPPISKGSPVASENAKTLISAEISNTLPPATRLGENISTAPTVPDLKPTRLGEPMATGAMKATRLGTLEEAAVGQNAAPASFFSKLTAIHYAGAGLVLLILIGGVIAIPLMLILMSGKPTANKTESKTESQKPDVITIQQQPSQQSSQPTTQPLTSNSPAAQTQQPGELTPVDTKPKDDKTSVTAPKPAAPKKEAPAPKPKQDKSRAEKLLTGN